MIEKAANHLVGLKAYAANAEVAKAKPVPHFAPNTVIRERSLVIDQNGVAWWVEPGSMTIMQA